MISFALVDLLYFFNIVSIDLLKLTTTSILEHLFYMKTSLKLHI